MDPHRENDATSYAMDEVLFHCQVKGEHKDHIADLDLAHLGKRVTITWGAGKPRVTEISISQKDRG